MKNVSKRGKNRRPQEIATWTPANIKDFLHTMRC